MPATFRMPVPYANDSLLSPDLLVFLFVIRQGSNFEMLYYLERATGQLFEAH
jgi:hypothetical protein